jgi:hypothetical protein
LLQPDDLFAALNVHLPAGVKLLQAVVEQFILHLPLLLPMT